VGVLEDHIRKVFAAIMAIINIYFWLSALLMLFASWVDWRSFRIPYLTIFGVGSLGFIYSYQQGYHMVEIVFSALAIGSGLFLLEYVSRKPILGYGDMQLFIACMMWLRLEQLPLFLVLTGITGAMMGVLLFRNQYFPLAPAISLAWFVSLLW
jgi:prepilin signal peptidase PulO-like enzyme (type II secretory pathway)